MVELSDALASLCSAAFPWIALAAVAAGGVLGLWLRHLYGPLPSEDETGARLVEYAEALRRRVDV